jgi:hypothetical protein
MASSGPTKPLVLGSLDTIDLDQLDVELLANGQVPVWIKQHSKKTLRELQRDQRERDTYQFPFDDRKRDIV